MNAKSEREIERVTVRLAGDSGDGMQVLGAQLTASSAVFGNDFSTLPNFPAEIRAPTGSLPGVSSFQLSFASDKIHTPGERPDALVAMNPAALKVHLPDLPRGGVVIVDRDEFTPLNLKKAGYAQNPLEDGSLSGYALHALGITSATRESLVDSALTTKEKVRCRNFYALGLLYWLYERPLIPTIERLQSKFAKSPPLAEANVAALKAGYAFGETTERFAERRVVPPAPLPPGVYRNITGNVATALGLMAAAELAGHPLFYASYPITPASDILHELSRHKRFGVRTFQAEDEIAAIGACVGAAFGGAVAATGTSGPGLALKGETLGLAVMAELPLVVVNVQRAGPSTGMPTKTEQGDLLQALYGRNGESPVPVLAPLSPADAFDTAYEAVRIALTHMTPVVVLSDGFLANSSEPWRVPQAAELTPIAVVHPSDAASFAPYARHPETLARPWALPGTPGLEHRIGSLEKSAGSGAVSYDAENHQQMSEVRAAKLACIAKGYGPLERHGEQSGELLVVGWGSSYGALRTAVENCRCEGLDVSLVQLRHLAPLHDQLGEALAAFHKILVVEQNLGQLDLLLRARYLVDTRGYHRLTGQPLAVSEVEAAIRNALQERRGLQEEVSR